MGSNASYFASFSYSWLSTISVAILIWVLSQLFKVIYRLSFHPLARFPGPKWAASTLLYEIYHDAVRGGQYTFVIEEMHKKYGPIVRISPEELHVNDPEFIKELYSGSAKKRNRWDYNVAQFGVPDSTGGSAGYEVHRIRRDALSNFFSKASITRLEPLIVKNVNYFCRRLDEFVGTQRPVALSLAFSCLACDIACEYAFSESLDFLKLPDFETPFHRAFAAAFMGLPLLKHIPWVYPLMDMITETPLFKPTSDMGYLAEWRKGIRSQIHGVQKQVAAGKYSEGGHMTIFEELIRGSLPEKEKAPRRLAQEAALVVAAGTETTAWVQSAIAYYVLAYPEVLSKLCKELESAIPDPDVLPSCAVISEGLRMGYGVCTRIQRVAPDEAMVLKSSSPKEDDITWVIPKGTPVSMSAGLIHRNPDIFPDPLVFRPERWIEDRRLDRYLISFSKGSRQCLGINLAHAELYLGTAALFRRFGHRMTLYQTTKDNVELSRDYFVPYPRNERHVKVTIAIA